MIHLKWECIYLSLWMEKKVKYFPFPADFWLLVITLAPENWTHTLINIHILIKIKKGSKIQPSTFFNYKHVYYFSKKLEASFKTNQVFNFTIMRMKDSSLIWGGHHMRHLCLMLLSNSFVKRRTSPHFLLAVQTMHKQETLKTVFFPASLSRKKATKNKILLTLAPLQQWDHSRLRGATTFHTKGIVVTALSFSSLWKHNLPFSWLPHPSPA